MLDTPSPTQHEERTESQFLESLVSAEIIDSSAATRILTAHQKTSEPYCRLMTRLGVIEEAALAHHLSGYLGHRLLTDDDIPTVPVTTEVSEQFLREEIILPLSVDPDAVAVAVADPFSTYAIKAIGLATRRRVKILVGELSRIERAIEQLYKAEQGLPLQTGAGAEQLEETDGDIQRLRDQAAEAPVIRLVNQLIQSAIELRASDIHLEPFQHQFQVRFRIDGILRDIPPPSPQLRTAIASRIKVMAHLDIAERRLPQDGRIRLTVKGKDVDLRVSTFPTMYGESVVLRVLDRSGISPRLDQLGFETQDFSRYLGVLSRPMGMVLVTGPTGSGKTTTLYASLAQLDRAGQKIFTVEDPIEYELSGVNQTQVKPDIGLTFASSLRSLMRQDPDVILIGEIRDLETAEIAGQSSLTGHLVLSTLHTNDAIAAVTRLRDMGMPAFLITATLTCVVAQRLVRVLCPACKIELAVDSRLRDFAAHLSVDLVHCEHVWGPSGCPQCNGTGYRGRVGIYEIFLVSEQARALIHRDAPTSDLRNLAVQEGMTRMAADGMRKITNGVTTLDEVQRVAGG
ncbi:GspE/PulE family protein [Hyphomicrobium sp. ghe19]|uniref:GspE/PulE family protein n=1 Tax=Hyphomicrobium sp. ghe19 TaxID=2682968 RepID=UPI001367767B|nr:Type II secretion system protein E [Hyphomicrobium sp. ghe19]